MTETGWDLQKQVQSPRKPQGHISLSRPVSTSCVLLLSALDPLFFSFQQSILSPKSYRLNLVPSKPGQNSALSCTYLAGFTFSRFLNWHVVLNQATNYVSLVNNCPSQVTYPGPISHDWNGIESCGSKTSHTEQKGLGAEVLENCLVFCLHYKRGDRWLFQLKLQPMCGACFLQNTGEQNKKLEVLLIYYCSCRLFQAHLTMYRYFFLKLFT